MIHVSSVHWIKRYFYAVTTIWVLIVSYLIATSVWGRLFPSPEVDDCLASTLPGWTNTHKPHNLHAPVSVFIAVISARSNHERRKFLRESSWLSLHLERKFPLPKGNWKLDYKFFVGNRDNYTRNTQLNEKIAAEQREFGDLVELDLVDHYRALPLKLALVRQWIAVEYEPHFDYLAKCDDDVWLHVRHLVEFIDSALLHPVATRDDRVVALLKPYRCRVIAGHFIDDMEVIRDETKWSDKTFPVAKYPSYPNGPLYVLSRDVVFAFTELFLTQSAGFFANEDVTVGVWAASMPIRKVASAKFTFQACLDNGGIAWHVVDIEESYLQSSHRSFTEKYNKCQKTCGCR